MIESIKLKNLSSLEEISVNMGNGPYYLEEANFGAIDGFHQSYKFPGQIGETVDSSNLETRSISITGWCVNTKKFPLSTAKALLNRFVNPQQIIRIYYEEYYIDFYPGSTIQYAKNHKDNNGVVCKFLIQGEAFFPLWSTAEAKESPVSYTQGRFVLPVSVNEENPIVFGEIHPTVATSVYNPGLPVGCKISIQAQGEVVNPKITCPETQESFYINKTLQFGEEILINTVVGNRYVQGYVAGETYNYLRYMGEGSSWITIPRYTNTISFSADSGSEYLYVSVSFEPSFLEVEY